MIFFSGWRRIIIGVIEMEEIMDFIFFDNPNWCYWIISFVLVLFILFEFVLEWEMLFCMLFFFNE